MSEHRVEVVWSRGDGPFDYESYDRSHTWRFPGGIEVAASSAPDYLGDAARVDPEESFVAAISSCHMLTFLAVAARRRLVVDRYEDAAVGFLEKNDAGRLAVTRVELHPRIRFGGDGPPDREQLARLHARAHQNCFIANSVSTRIDVCET